MTSGGICPISRLEKLLVATDRSLFSQGAIEEAINFAKQCSSRLLVVSVIESNPEYETIGSQFFKKEEEEAIQYLASVKARAEQEGLSCATFLRQVDDPAGLIAAEAAANAVDMIVVGRHGRTGLLKVFMGKVAARIIGRAPCKVLVVPKEARIQYRSILVATDGSAYSMAAATEAVGIAKRRGSSIIALSVAATKADLESAKANADKVAGMAQKEDIQAEAIALTGKAAETIVEAAAGRGVDLIVMGTYGQTGLKKFMMGSTSEKVIGLSGCAVLVVKA